MHDASVIKRPNGGSVIFHWLGAVLIFLALLAGLFAVYGSGGCCAADRRIAFLIHAYAVLASVVLRLMFRASYSWPNAAYSGIARLGDIAAKIIHWTMYGMMILIPLTGWIMASGMACCWSVPGLPDVNMLSLGISDLSMADIGAAYRVHVALVWMIIALIALHVSTALFQHLFQNNDILRRMLPGRMSPKVKNVGRATTMSTIINKGDA